MHIILFELKNLLIIGRLSSIINFMVTILFGIACIAFTIFACLPMGLNWGENVLFVLKGAAPVIAVFIGIVAILLGIADLRDRQEAKREELEMLNEK